MAFQIKYVYDLVDKISPSLRKIQANTKQTSSVVQSQAMKIGRSFDHIGDKMKRLGKRSAEIGRNLFIKMTLPITLLGGSFIKAASDYQESINKVDVAFGSASESVKKFANSAGKNFGIDRGAALDMAAMFGDMATGMGITQNKASGLATSLVGLAGDLASFKNIGVDQAQTALAAIFTGETESLKRLGIVMTETNLKQFALTQGIRTKMKNMKQAEKVLLRYNYVVAMSKNSVGDFIRTQEGFANQFRILKSRFKDLSITLGSILLPYAVKFINLLIRLIEKFQALSPRTQKIVLILAALAAILPPILITIGLMASGISALVSGFGLFAIAATGVASVIKLISIAMRANPIGIMITLIAAAIIYWKDLGKMIDNIVNKIKNINFGKIGKFFGIESGKIIHKSVLQQTSIPKQTSINQRQDVNVGGQLDINFGNMPKGTNTKFTPIRQNSLPVGLNSVYGGA